MKNFYFDNFGNNSFLVYKLNNEEKIDEITLSMITNNDIVGVLKAIVSQVDNEKFIKYNITSKIQASKLFADNVNKDRVLDVFEEIVKSAIEVENYLIPVDRLLFNLEEIYVDVATNETSLICLPIDEQNERVDLKEFFKNILFNAKFDQRENNDYVGRLINSLNSMTDFSNEAFLQAINEIRGISKEQFNQVNVNKNIYTEKQEQNKKNNMPIERPQIKEEVSYSSEIEQKEMKPKEEKKKGFISMPNFKNNTEDEEVLEEEYPEEDEEKITFLNLLTGFTGEKYKKYKEQKSRDKAKKDKNKKNKKNPSKYDFDKVTKDNKKSEKKTENNAETRIENKVEDKAEPTTQKGRYGDFGDTTVLGNDSRVNETTVLTENTTENSPTEKRPYLIREKNNERILIDSEIFKIGSEKSYVNYHIYDNTSISRSHAIISKVADSYYVEDTNSTNHTYINGEILTPNTKIEIHDNDELKLADEKFKFTLI